MPVPLLFLPVDLRNLAGSDCVLQAWASLQGHWGRHPGPGGSEGVQHRAKFLWVFCIEFLVFFVELDLIFILVLFFLTENTSRISKTKNRERFKVGLFAAFQKEEDDIRGNFSCVHLLEM